ncbi:lysyl oxidase homolog 2-like [Lytechinus variegatus]|uniref:lysyl oxidase homolog 2-like n=1 Tax=Lytechinus variegatus TaxID=7654 RepID=UPI001BB25A14|nr:lysyl oxidase homolog 2-like [Lytechinus variegatus]
MGSSQVMWLDYQGGLKDVHCFGNESNILECNHSRYQVRLIGGYYPSEGKVEVFHRGTWKPICNDQWGITEAQVVCRELGLGTVKSLDVGITDIEGKGGSCLTDIHCRGNESSIFDCLGSTLGEDMCNSSRLAEVRCSVGVRLVGGESHHEGQVQVFYQSRWIPTCGNRWNSFNIHVICRNAALSLVGGGNMFEGKILYYHYEQWRSVCSEKWNMPNADIFCRSLGYGNAQSIIVSNTENKTHDDVTLDNVYCTGTEDSFFDCPGVGDGSLECNRTGDPRVVCSGGMYD